ncbi:S-4TM family putative pore-forming effector [Proteus faecis]|uniref:S-4TM family putative pore-forming effector n=1 Tax=Proteus faecis TaxID=2050967 RepID=UPI00301E231C
MSITKRQNCDDNLKLLAAQRKIYSEVKNLIGTQVALSFPIAGISVALIIFYPQLKNYVALWGIFMLCLDLFFLTPKINEKRLCAAKVQELFDTKVLNLPWNELLADKKPNSEIIFEKSSEYKENPKRPLKDWYPTIIDKIPEIYAVIICQRTNVWWDSEVRRKYASLLTIIIVIIALSIIAFAIYDNRNLFDFLVYLLAPLSSTFVFCYRQIKEHRKTADLLDKLREKSDNIWLNILNKKITPRKLKENSRVLQDIIFDHRKRNIPVFDFFFTLYRNKHEKLTNNTAEEYVNEYLKKNRE